MRYSLALLGSAIMANAFPQVMDISNKMMEKRDAAFYQAVHERSVEEKRQLPSTTAAQTYSKSRKNCGVVDCLVFNANEQFVSTTGQYAYASPSAGQIRGPCPGLNAAANHGYLDRSGVQTMETTINGLGSLYGMSVDLAGFLAAYAIIFDGDPVLGTWSIGGPPPSDTVTDAILGQGQGITWAHNIYEGDTSIGRSDAYLNNGDAHSLNIDRFKSAYAATAAAAGDNSVGADRYTLDAFAQNFGEKVQESISTNPYYFAPVFSTTLVAPAAYNFVINFMSNHTADEPNGYFDGAMFKEFFAVSGDTPDDFKWLPGQERIPDNWYRRTSSNQYNALNVFTDLLPNWAAYPDTFRLGGNTNGVNTYGGVSLTDLTGGVFTLSNLVTFNNGVPDASNAACFFSQAIQQGIPDPANLPLAQVAPIADMVNKYIKTIVPSGFDCPIVDKYDQTLFNQYPGHTYRPTGPATNY
ncbi:hypothetical protein DOTSEDRAFT_176075 [Dothistroma septosporum NZE10]|uniref:Heme haloperoxidase family profile domain-containing protein n=1 Tax=Dothistroma septosporum (strain NZE10 / CBS 128990) TaxID=675120 RepID=N1PMQ3_DOTSN|nr:hypothetical protein DOTSEDRAFT_176075 [Dothistroma septosporum NZE10]